MARAGTRKAGKHPVGDGNITSRAGRWYILHHESDLAEIGTHRVAARRFVELVLWRVPAPLKGSLHFYKYRLALVSRGTCVLRYDNEAGKGDHRHLGYSEEPYSFKDIDTLLQDFRAQVGDWLNENGRA